MIKKLFLPVLFFLFAAMPAQAQQQSRDELQKEQRQLQKEIDDLNYALQSTRKNKKQSLSQLAIIKHKLAVRERLINNINRDIHRIDDDIYAKELERNHLKKELDTLKQNYAQSIVFAYKNRSSYEYLNFLFSATNFNDAIKRATYLKSYRKYRETEAQTILKTQDLLKETIGNLNSSKTEKSKVLVTQSSQLKVLEQDKKEKDQVVKQLKDQEKDLTAQIRKRETQRQNLKRALDAAIRREMEEAQRKEKERISKQKLLDEQKRLQAGNNKTNTEPDKNSIASVKPRPLNNEPITGVVTVGGNSNRTYNLLESTPDGLTRSINFENNRGRLPWPVSSGYTSHQFGIHKIEGTKLTEKNDGIYIATEIGTNVKCVADGEVISVFDINDAQTVLVQHGKYFTSYSNLSSVNVSKGQKVNAGTILGKVAANFDNNGELIFEIVSDKKFLDPERWLRPR
ncbi:murein hydrolase activator EnvC precursor [mine drainage metagenome]|uniref:Murein hydrolase activator EnvC n=1 Tax=mine drainage metagenome TaxID=410659 RepID=A0A1J5SSQ2_9ZZZZ